MISRYQGNIGCCGRFDCRKEGGKNIHRTKGNVMKSVRLGHALRGGGGYHLRFPLRGASTPRNSAQLPLCFRTSDNRHSSSSRSVPLFPEVWTPPGSRRRKEREERRKGRTNEWRRRKERMSCLPLEKRDRPIRMDKKAFPLSLPLSLLENETVSGRFV